MAPIDARVQGWNALAAEAAAEGDTARVNALIQSGRGAGAEGLVQAGLCAARWASAPESASEAKNACHDGSTEFGSLAHFA